MTRFTAALAAALLLGVACQSGAPTGNSASAPRIAGSLDSGLIAFIGDQGVGVIDPSNGKLSIVSPLPGGGAFRAVGPVWAGAPDVGYPVLYFTIHDDRPAERRDSPGVVPYDWIFRVDPFTGVIEPVAASFDSQSEGPLGLVGNSRYLALTVGCCATYEVDALDLTQTAGPLKVLSKPPAQAAFFTQGAAPGRSALIAVRAFGTGAWYWLNAEAGVLNPFPISLGPDDGPIAISADGTLVAVAAPDKGPVIRPISVAVPIASPSPSADATAAPSASPTPSPSPAAPRRVNSKLAHPDGLAWSPDAKQLLVAVNGELQLYNASAPDGTAPVSKYASGANVQGVAWSRPIPGKTFAMVKPNGGPLAMVDALLAATKLPAEADTAANRPLTKVYLWQFDSTKTSPISSITDASPATLAKYPPLNAGVVFHHWAPPDTWELLGGCYRYRVVITGSVQPTAATFGLGGGELCSTPKPSPSASASASAKPT
jgi:hypothetical protein